MRKVFLSFVLLASFISYASEPRDLAQSAALVLEFQSAVATYDEHKAMSFIAPDAELIFTQADGTEHKFSGIVQITEAYAKNWFSIPSKMVSLEEANFSYTADGEFKYRFKGVFSVNDRDGWKESARSSVTYFTVSDGKIVLIRRFQERL